MNFQQENRTLRLARLVSGLLSPPLVAGVTFPTLVAFDNPVNFVLTVLLTLTFGTIAPLAVVLFARDGNVSSNCGWQQSRAFQFLLAIGSYIVGSILLLEIGAPRSVIALMVCYLGNSFVMMLVSLRWKISVHASGVTGPGTVLTYVLGPAWLPFFLLSIPVAWARIKEGAHTPLQVVAGAALTVLTTWLQLRLLLK